MKTRAQLDRDIVACLASTGRMAAMHQHLVLAHEHAMRGYELVRKSDSSTAHLEAAMQFQATANEFAEAGEIAKVHDPRTVKIAKEQVRAYEALRRRHEHIAHAKRGKGQP
jgi:hypothetical protein